MLGKLLIPRELVCAARRHKSVTGAPLPLAIAPSASLGYVPWSLLVTAGDDPGDVPEPDRLLDICDWVLAPSATLLMHATPASADLAPLALAVVDTCATRQLGALPGARRQAQSLPSHITVLGGRHWTEAIATVTELESQLRRQRDPFTLAFMCHAVRGTPDEPSAGGLVIASATCGTQNPARSGDLTPLMILQPSTILEMASRKIPMPTQVLLQACDTSALSDVTAGEWLTVAPAFIVGGCREVIATLYPVPDGASIDDVLMRAAVAGTSLREALRNQQRQELVRWISGTVSDITHAPLTWAAYAPICVRVSNSDQVAQPESQGHQASRVTWQEVVSIRCVRVLEHAVKLSRETRAKRLDSGYVLCSYLEEAELAELFDGAGDSFRPSALLWTFAPYVLSRFLRFRDRDMRPFDLPNGDRILLPNLLIDAIRAAREAAIIDGTLIEPEHVVLSLLSRHSAARRILKLLSRVGRRHAELTTRAIDHKLADQVAKPMKERTTTTLSDRAQSATEIIDFALTATDGCRATKRQNEDAESTTINSISR